MEFEWDSNGTRMGLEWDMNGTQMAFEWHSNGIGMGLKWDSNETGMEFEWDLNWDSSETQEMYKSEKFVKLILNQKQSLQKNPEGQQKSNLWNRDLDFGKWLNISLEEREFL